MSTKIKITWTDAEVSKIVDAFMDLRATDILGDTLELLRGAMNDALPKERHRDIAQLANAKAVVQALQLRRLYAHSGTATAAQAPAAQEVPVPVVASITPAPRPEPVVIEFRVPQEPKLDDVAAVLARAPTALLLGAALERVLSGPPRGVVDVVRTTFDVSATSTSVAAPATETPIVTRCRVVVVLGLLPSAEALVAERVKAFTNLEVVFRNPTTIGSAVPVLCDYAVLMKGMVNQFQADAVRRRFVRAADQRRLITVDGGNDKLLQELNTLNAQQ